MAATMDHSNIRGLGTAFHLFFAGLPRSPGSAVYSLRRALVALRPANLVRLRIQQSVERLLHARADPFVDMVPQLPFVNSQRSQRRRCIVSHGGGLSKGLVRWCLAVPIEPDRGHRLEMCENYVTS